MAGLATGIWSGLDEIAALPQEFGRFEPRMSESLTVPSFTMDGRWQSPEQGIDRRPS